MCSNCFNVAAAAETHCNGSIANAAMTATYAMKMQLQKLTATVAMQTAEMGSNSCNSDAAAETHCNGLIVTAAMNCNNCNEAAAAETNCNSCIETAAIS